MCCVSIRPGLSCFEPSYVYNPWLSGVHRGLRAQGGYYPPLAPAKLAPRRPHIASANHKALRVLPPPLAKNPVYAPTWICDNTSNYEKPSPAWHPGSQPCFLFKLDFRNLILSFVWKVWNQDVINKHTQSTCFLRGVIEAKRGSLDIHLPKNVPNILSSVCNLFLNWPRNFCC